MVLPVRKTSRWRPKPKEEVPPPPLPPSSSQYSTQKTRSGYTIYISDDDTPPPEKKSGGVVLKKEVKGKGKEKEIIMIDSSSDYGGSSDNEALIVASQEVDIMHSSQVQVRGSSTSYGGSSDNEDLIAASQEVEIMHSSQAQVQDLKKVVARGSSTSYGGSSDNRELVAAAKQIELMRSWVDAGIQMAIEEARMEAEGRGSELERENDGVGGSLIRKDRASQMGLRDHPQTPVDLSYGQNSRDSNGSIPYYNPGVSQYPNQPAFPGQQYTPAASIPRQSQGYYTPQHAVAYASQFPPQNTQQYPPQGYYATPPTSEPPFLQSGGQFHSSALPQLSPTPGPYGMTAFHSGKIPQSSGFVSSTQQPLARQPLARQPGAPASNNIQSRETATNTKLVEQPYILPPDQYLSWHELEHHYGPSRASYPTAESHARARLDWLANIKMDIALFTRPWVAEYKKQEVEDTWAGFPATQRQRVEMAALAQKYKTKVQAPRRQVPPEALPLTFIALEAQYFSIPERKLSGYADTMRKRATWLQQLGLVDPVYLPPCTNPDQELVIETIYSQMSIVKRRAIEAKAKFLNLQFNPPKPSFKAFEAQYCIHKREDCPSKTEYKLKRETWLKGIGLLEEPFSWLPYTHTEFGVTQEENTEVAWDGLGAERRAEIIATAEKYLKDKTWGASWGSIEKKIGFKPEDGERYTQWLSAIGMGKPLKAGETRDAIWMGKSDRDREAIWRLAVRTKKEMQDRWDAKERAAMGITKGVKRKRTVEQPMDENEKRGKREIWKIMKKHHMGRREKRS